MGRLQQFVQARRHGRKNLYLTGTDSLLRLGHDNFLGHNDDRNSLDMEWSEDAVQGGHLEKEWDEPHISEEFDEAGNFGAEESRTLEERAEYLQAAASAAEL